MKGSKRESYVVLLFSHNPAGSHLARIWFHHLPKSLDVPTETLTSSEYQANPLPSPLAHSVEHSLSQILHLDSYRRNTRLEERMPSDSVWVREKSMCVGDCPVL